MNVTELARRLRINTKDLLEVLPEYGFDVGKKAIKVDDKVASKIMKSWRRIRRELDEKKRQEAEERKLKERELRKQSGQKVLLPSVITVRDFSEKLGMSVTEVITELMKNGILANQNQNIDYETAAIMAGEFGFDAQKEGEDVVSDEKQEEEAERIEEELAQRDELVNRPPVIVVMGHVDHGKTKLLDAIRETNIIDTESGGITQHIGAYQTIWKDPKTKEGRPITFIDTPGHEAFTVMRSRGAKVADIAILIVAADDGVKPQTEEVIQIIKAAKLPFVVAINKIDREGADPQRVMTELSQKGIQPEAWGGDVPMVEISAKEKINIDKLLDVLLLVSDMNEEEIKGDPKMPAMGTVVESHVDKNMGPVATVLVQTGTLNLGDPLVVNKEIYGKVRAMRDYKGEGMEMADPSTPVQIVGFKVAPEVGDILNVGDASGAKKIDVRAKKVRQTGAEKSFAVATQSNEDDSEEGKKKTLNLLIKADVLGSLEAIVGSLEKLKHDEVGVSIVGKGLGNISEDDIGKAEAGNAVLIGFKVKANPAEEETLREKNISFLRYDVIYDLINWAKEELEKLLTKEEIITELGNLKVMAIFRTDKGAMTVGGRVESGKAQKGARVRVIRGGENMGEGELEECQTGKQAVNEVPSGTECGLRFKGKTRIEEGDVLEFYSVESKTRKIEFN